MKTLKLLAILIFVAVTSHVAFAGGSNIGNGGDGDEITLHLIAKSLATYLYSPKGKMTVPAVDAAAFDDTVMKTKIQMTTETLTDSDGKVRMAINQPALGRILVNRALLSTIRGEPASLVTLVFHEILGIMGLETTGDYHLSLLVKDASPTIYADAVKNAEGIVFLTFPHVKNPIPVWKESIKRDPIGEGYEGIIARPTHIITPRVQAVVLNNASIEWEKTSFSIQNPDQSGPNMFDAVKLSENGQWHHAQLVYIQLMDGGAWFSMVRTRGNSYIEFSNELGITRGKLWQIWYGALDQIFELHGKLIEVSRGPYTMKSEKMVELSGDEKIGDGPNTYFPFLLEPLTISFGGPTLFVCDSIVLDSTNNQIISIDAGKKKNENPNCKPFKYFVNGQNILESDTHLAFDGGRPIIARHFRTISPTYSSVPILYTKNNALLKGVCTAGSADKDEFHDGIPDDGEVLYYSGEKTFYDLEKADFVTRTEGHTAVLKSVTCRFYRYGDAKLITQ